MSLQIDIQKITSLLQQGQFKPALKAAKIAMKRHKSHPVFPNLAAVALSALRKEREAVPYYQKALKLDANFHEARRNLGIALLAINQNEAAIKALSRCVEGNAEDVAALVCLSRAQRACGYFDAARHTLDQAARLSPNTPDILRQQAELLEEQGEIRAAIEQLERIHEIEPTNMKALFSLADLLIYQTETDRVLLVLRKALEQEPQNTRALGRLAAQLLAMGQREEGLEVLLSILEIDPADAVAWEQISIVQQKDQPPEIASRIDAALEATPVRTLNHAILKFARANLSRSLDGPEISDPLYVQANAEIAALKPYDRREQQNLNCETIRRFASVLPSNPQQSPSPRPIFITGLPRSGTTLAEAVLAAHPEVVSLGERRIDNQMVAALEKGQALDTAQIERLSQVTRENLPDLAKEARFYVDKMPENHRFIGILAQAFPDAAFINMTRDPRDIALSQWHALFGDGAITYSYDLNAMAHRFNLYAEIMQHWHNIMPGRILDLNYEELVADISTSSKSMAKHCGLDWQPEMATPHRNIGQVLTVSREQVREPVHNRSVKKWVKHQHLLTPFIDGLDKGLWTEID